jgi:hypothetical protein
LTSFPLTLSQSINSRIKSPLQVPLAHRFLLLLCTRHTQAILRAGTPPKRSKKGVPRLPICSHNPEHLSTNSGRTGFRKVCMSISSSQKVRSTTDYGVDR